MAALLALLSFSLGIALGQIGSVPPVIFIVIGVVCLVMFFWNWKRGISFLLIIISFFIGMLRMQLAEERFERVEFPNESNIVAEVRSVDIRPESMLIYARPEDAETTILIRSYEKVLVLPGDVVQSTGVIKLPEPFVTDTNRIFDYPGYLKSKHTALIQNAKSIEVLEEGKRGAARFFAKLNRGTTELLARAVPYPLDGVVAGMVLGERGSIPEYVTDIFQNTGTLHLLVLSGYNITLLVTFLGLLLRRVPFYIRVSILGISIISLVLLSGAGIAAIRAGAMGLIAIVGTVSGRQYAALRALGVTFIFLLLWNPYLLLSDPGFQLSFLATLCMVAVVPKAEPLFVKVPEKVWKLPLRETAAITVTVSLFMLPFIAYFSGSISLLTIPANFIAAFFVPVITLFGIATIVIAVLFPILGVLIGTILGFIGNVLLVTLETAARVPQLIVPPFSWWWVAGMYGVIFLILFWKGIKKPLMLLKGF